MTSLKALALNITKRYTFISSLLICNAMPINFKLFHILWNLFLLLLFIELIIYSILTSGVAFLSNVWISIDIVDLPPFLGRRMYLVTVLRRLLIGCPSSCAQPIYFICMIFHGFNLNFPMFIVHEWLLIRVYKMPILVILVKQLHFMTVTNRIAVRRINPIRSYRITATRFIQEASLILLVILHVFLFPIRATNIASRK